MRGWSLTPRRLAKKRCCEPDFPENGETRSLLTGAYLRRKNWKKRFFIIDLILEQFPCPDKFRSPKVDYFHDEAIAFYQGRPLHTLGESPSRLGR
jgi:hypothetical protein